MAHRCMSDSFPVVSPTGHEFRHEYYAVLVLFRRRFVMIPRR